MDYDYMLYPEYHEHIRRGSCSDLTRGFFGDSISCEFCKSLGKKNQFDKLLSADSKGTTNCRSSRLQHLDWLSAEGGQNVNHGASRGRGGIRGEGASRGRGFGNHGPKKVESDGHGKKKAKKQTAKSIPAKDGNIDTNTKNEEKDDYVKVCSYGENEESTEDGWTLI